MDEVLATESAERSADFKKVTSPKLVSFEEVMSHFSNLDASKMYGENWALKEIEKANKKYKYWIQGKIPLQTIQAILLPDHQHDWGGKTERSRWLVPHLDTPVARAAQRYLEIKNKGEAKACISKIENLKKAIRNQEDIGSLFLRDDEKYDSFQHIDCVHRAIAYSLLAEEGVDFDPPIVLIATNDLSKFGLTEQEKT